jgi:fatty-acyl-CoA synthase
MTFDPLQMTIGDLLDRQAVTLGDREALVHYESGIRFTYAELRANAGQIARGLMTLGVAKGDHVALWAPNRPEWFVIQLAAAKIGAVLVTINPDLRPPEVQYIVQQSDAQVLLISDRFRYVDAVRRLVPDALRHNGAVRDCAALPHLRYVVTVGDRVQDGMLSCTELHRLGEGIPLSALAERQASCCPGDVTTIQYTSGTDGFAKGVMLTHRNVLGNAYDVTGCLELTPDDRVCLPVPLFHCFGGVMGALGCLTRGASLVLPSAHFDVDHVLGAIQGERCTALYGVPTMFLVALHHADFVRYDLSSLRTGIMAGSPCPVDLMRQTVERMGIHGMTIAYGQTEASPAITQTRISDPLGRRLTTVGQALPGVEVRIVDPVSGTDAPPGVQGELWTRGFHVMAGYYRMPDATAVVLDAAGWLRTGDLATMDAEGFCKITGRLRDMIIRGGENVYPREIEDFLRQHPSIADVHVVGVPDLRYGEEVMAWILLEPGASMTVEEVHRYCRGRLANFKIPHYIKFVSALPLSETGKVRKADLRSLAIAEYGLAEAARVETA